MTYEKALDYIHGLRKNGIKEGLTGVSELLYRLGDPHKGLRCVHVAGTNGKGTACAIISSILTRSGYKTGLTVSPYVVDFRERFQIDGEMVSREKLARLTSLVKAAADDIMESGGQQPTEFEAVTALAFLYFKTEGCDVCVVEVGLGGRLDSTNVIEKPELSVIMSIGLDHMQYLGADTAAIAAEKAGIMKPGADVIIYPDQPPGVMEVLRGAAAQKGARLIEFTLAGLIILSEDVDGSEFSYGGEIYRTPFAGRHQVYNALTAVMAAWALEGAFPRITGRTIHEGLEGAHNPGRIEIIEGNPPIILDGAHNPQAIDALYAFLQRQFHGRPLLFIMGMMADKDCGYCIGKVARMADALVAVEPQNSRRLPANDVASLAADCPIVRTAGNVGQALETARSLCPPDGVIIICGSLYIVSDARKLLVR